MICDCKPTVDDVISFMDGVSFATECTSAKSHKMHSIADISLIPWSTMYSVMVQTEKCSSQQSTFLVVEQTDLVVFDFYNPSRKESVHIKYVLIKDSLMAGMHGTYWSNQCMNWVWPKPLLQIIFCKNRLKLVAKWFLWVKLFVSKTSRWSE